MADAPVQIHVRTHRDLRDGVAPPWSDPLGFATITPVKLRALLSNPLLGPDEDPVQLIGTKGGVAIGRIDLVRGIVHVMPEGAAQAHDVPVYWGSEWYVPEEHRSTLVGVLLLLKLQQMRLNLGAHGPSQMAVPVYQKLKWADLPFPRHILPRRSRSIVEKFVGAGPHAALLSLLADAGLAAHGVVLRRSLRARTAPLHAEPVEHLPPELDADLRRPEPGKASCHRSVAWLHWACSAAFNEDARTRRQLALVRGQAGKVVGHLVVKTRFFETASARGFKNVLLGSVHDWMVYDEGRRQGVRDDQLILLGAGLAASMGVDALEVCTDDAPLRDTLKKMLFREVGAMHLVFKGAVGGPLADAAFTKPGSWRIRPGDADNFLI
jgi:hypothetical protein